MNLARPQVAPALVATVIESAPDRVRRRLDRAPAAAADWNWQQGPAGWSVEASGETVLLPAGHVRSLDQVSCTCLLAPRCFHILACLTHLEVALAAPVEQEDSPDKAEIEETAATAEEPHDLQQPTESQRAAAAELSRCAGQLLRVGVAGAGVVVQSGLLRAVHQGRAEGLHRAAALGLRVLAGAGAYRTREADADPAQLAEEIADLLETTEQIVRQPTLASYWIGTARRQQLPVRPRKLHGLFAEPIVTRSGYAGAVAYFLGEDHQLYQAGDVRPGDVQLARDAYNGGIEIGALIQPARQLARSLYLGTDLTASRDGRLGRGKQVKLVKQGPSTWQADTIQHRFQTPLLDQWETVYRLAALPADARPAGWDLMFLAGVIVGAAGAELLFQLRGEGPTLRLAIANDSAGLLFRENLRMLSHAPGLRLQLIARLNLAEPMVVSPLAAATWEPPASDTAELPAPGPSLDLPPTWEGRVCLGLDELKRAHLPRAQASAVVLGDSVAMADDPLASLRRRWVAMMLSGAAARRPANITSAPAEAARLQRAGFSTGADLLEAVSQAHGGSDSDSQDAFLAVAIYLRTCRHEWARASAALALGDAG